MTMPDRRPGRPGERREAEVLERLLVIDRLEVGPVELKPDGLRMPYRVHAAGGVDETVLSYRWEEKVFDPDAPADLQLASLVGVQVALNYGLFCRELVLHGPFDEADRAWLVDMAENTAREIYVNKLLAPNPFIRGLGELPAERRERFLQARLLFPDAAAAPARTVESASVMAVP